MNTVTKIIRNTDIGRTGNGDNVVAVNVEYSDGVTGVMWRIDNRDGKVYGLQATQPVIVGTHAAVGLFDMVPA